MEINLSGKMSDTQQRVLKSEQEKKHFYSHFAFLNNHNGFRNGNIHTILGVSHGGKSTLTRTLIVDVLANRPKKKILLWLSEETRLEFLQEFIASNFTEYDEDQLLIYSEMDNQVNDHTTLKHIEDIVIQKNVDILFFDNITTSRIYMDQQIQVQSQRASLLKKFANAWNIPIVIIAHTKAEITENYNGIINMNDIRGNKSIVNISQFFYILQTFTSGVKKFSTLRLAKHRGYVVSDTIYQLIFAKPVKMFALGEAIKFDDFAAAFKNRNKL